MKRTFVQIVLDGWGLGRKDESNPWYMVNPKSFAWLKENFPVTSLQASGISVGLPWGEVGNSEVGHLTLGAGKVLYQYYPKITMAIRDKSFYKNAALKNAFSHAKENNSAVNLVGLLTKANVHASLDHLEALMKMGEIEGAPEIKLHLFADGKDSDPKTVVNFLKQIPKSKLATLIGRYYAMDRSKNWKLTEVAYENLTGNGTTIVEDPMPTIENTFKKGLTEEYLPPIHLGENKFIKDGESVIFFNYREDSIRQLAESFILKGFNKFPVKEFKNLRVVTMSRYENALTAPVAFPADTVEKSLGQTLSESGKTQLRLAETYKYAHVTYFFSGYREKPFKGEYRILIPSLSTPKPEEHPELMASAITDRLIEAVQNNTFDFILVNYSNLDTIGHTANYDAGLEAVKTIDKEMGRFLKVALNPQTLVVITSDHGNIEGMIDPATGLPESGHDPSPVPFYLVGQEFKNKKFVNWKSIETETMGSLADVAPTILELMEIPKPEEMAGRSLLEGLM